MVDFDAVADYLVNGGQGSSMGYVLTGYDASRIQANIVEQTVTPPSARELASNVDVSWNVHAHETNRTPDGIALAVKAIQQSNGAGVTPV